MAVFDPTKQIQQIGQQTVQSLDKAGQQIVNVQRSKTAMAERMFSQIEAIKEEANAMHKEFLQEEIDSLQGDLADKIFKQRSAGKDIDIKGFEGLNQKISKIKNMATNSKVAADLYAQASEMVMKDQYVYNKRGAMSALMSLVSDKQTLSQSPDGLTKSLMGVYTGSVDKVSKVGDILRSQLGTESISRTIQGEDGDYDVSYQVVKGIHNPDGSLKNDAIRNIMDEASKAGEPISEEEAMMVANRFSNKFEKKANYDRKKMEQQDKSYGLKLAEFNAKRKKDQRVETQIPADVANGLLTKAVALENNKSFDAAVSALEQLNVRVDIFSGKELAEIKNGNDLDFMGDQGERSKFMGKISNLDYKNISPDARYIYIDGKLIEASDANRDIIELTVNTALENTPTARNKETWNSINEKYNKNRPKDSAPEENNLGFNQPIPEGMTPEQFNKLPKEEQNRLIEERLKKAGNKNKKEKTELKLTEGSTI